MQQPTIKIVVSFVAMLFISYLVSAQIDLGGRHIGVVLSAQDYPLIQMSREQQLTTVLNESEELVSMLRNRYEFDTIIYIPDPKKKDYESTIEWLKEEYEITDDDHLFIMFNGHGQGIETRANGEEYSGRLYFTDTQLESDASYLSYKDLIEDMKSLKARHVFILLDVCYGGSMFETTLTMKGSSDKTTPKAPVKIEDKNGGMAHALNALPSIKGLSTCPARATVREQNLNFRLFFDALKRNENNTFAIYQISSYISSRRIDELQWGKVNPMDVPAPEFGVIKSGGEFQFVLKRVFIPQLITARLSSFSVRESSNSSVTYSISIPRIVNRDISVEYVLGGTAQRELDYEIKGLATSGKLVIPAGQRSASLQIKILDDKLADDDKKLAILLQKNTVINGMLNGSKSTLNIVDDEAELNKRIEILLKRFIEEGYQGRYIDIKELTRRDLPGHIKIQDFTNNMPGKYFKISVDGFYFEPAEYCISDISVHGGINSNVRFEHLNKAIEELRMVAIGIFEEYEKNQDGNDELYKILLLGGADAVYLGPTDLVSPYTQRCYTHLEVVPYMEGKGFDFERLKKCTLGTNSYTTMTTGFQQCNHGTDQYCNEDLPHLRLAFTKDIFSRYQEIEEDRVISLESFVSATIDPNMRGCMIILYVDDKMLTR
jgi:small nuclear ribonucleoprotein (snRNP)-like protein